MHILDEKTVGGSLALLSAHILKMKECGVFANYRYVECDDRIAKTHAFARETFFCLVSLNGECPIP